jgi:erythromycin esterase
MVNPTDTPDLDRLLERIGDARCVLLGEASHGTHEYYTWRTEISKRLIREKGFSFIAAEGDWPDCYRINRYVKGFVPDLTAEALLRREFTRWPTWMWANWEVAALAEWLRGHNQRTGQKAGFYGLDVYSLWESMDEMSQYLKREDPQAASIVHRALRCFQPYGSEGQEYAMAVSNLSESCQEQVIELLRTVRNRAGRYNHDPEASLNTEQNAHVAVNAEKYYRAMLSFGPDSWNIRDTHMADTLDRLLDFHGPRAKAIVWAHNTHIGDARYTDMIDTGEINLGQLARERYGRENVVLVGFGSFAGTVIAGSGWGAPMQRMPVPPAREGSIEALLHGENAQNQLLLFDTPATRKRYGATLPHRAIGVVYRPEREKYGNYVPTVLPERYDAFIYLDQTRALHPMHIAPDGHQTPETYPFGT